MLNPASRFEENAEAPSSLLRPLAIFFVIALALAMTSRQSVQAASREQASRHAASAKVQPESMREARSHSTSHRTRARSAKATTSARHERPAKRAVSSRGRRRVTNSGRRSASRSVASQNIHSKKASLETVAASRPSAAAMARPVAGASSLVEAASPGVYASGASHPVEGDRLSTVAANDAAANTTASLSPSDMAQAAVAPHVFPMYTRAGRLIVPPPLRGSREILVHQNEMADAAGLERIENNDELDRLRMSTSWSILPEPLRCISIRSFREIAASPVHGLRSSPQILPAPTTRVSGSRWS